MMSRKWRGQRHKVTAKPGRPDRVYALIKVGGRVVKTEASSADVLRKYGDAFEGPVKP